MLFTRSTMTRLALFALVPLFSAVSLFVLYHAGLDAGQILSPQGCRMSWMSPSYIQQTQFNISWSPLAKRYSLWFYREVGWEPNQVQGVPVLFIPGNAGSSHQVRSIASSATRQFYVSPYEIAPNFKSGELKPLDFFAVEFNEDLSAFHGPTIDSQVAYSSRAISYILSQYPANTTIIIMGHSMGGIVATSLLPSPNISAIITMSTPHILPPARFDSRIDKIYATNQRALLSDPTPMISLCGGATDLTIPTESCVLPSVDNAEVYRRTVFTTALEGAWTGVGHLEMVWCHQVRWRVARTALELGASNSTEQKVVVLDKWLRDGHTATAESNGDETTYLTDPNGFDRLRTDMHLVLEKPQSSWTYTLPVPSVTSSSTKFILLLSRGSIPPVSPQNSLPLRASVFLCVSAASDGTSQKCNTLKPTVLKLIPNPIPGQTFPMPNEGTDESEGVVLYEADIPQPDIATVQRTWVGVRTENADGRGWLVAGFSEDGNISYDVDTSGLLLGHVSVTIPNRGILRTQISFPNLLSSALIVYRLSPTSNPGKIASTCPDLLLPPLVVYTSNPPETQFFPLLNEHSTRILLHTHSSAPYVPTPGPILRHGVNLTIYSSGARGCSSDNSVFGISIDKWATLGRLGTRYFTTLVSWVVGVVALIAFRVWGIYDAGAPVPTVHQSLTQLGLNILPKLLLGSCVVSYVPLPESYYLGNKGEPFFALLGPVLILIATGLVFISWWVLLALMWPLGQLGRVLLGRYKESTVTSVPRSTLVSMAVILLVIFLFVPWQVAYLGCWIIHLFNCASSSPSVPISGSPSTPVTPPSREDEYRDAESTLSRAHEKVWYSKANDHNHAMHVLLLMTWLLPLVAPVLAVWVRTLMTAGLTTPFDGDHFFLNVAPFLILVDFASWTTGPLFLRPSSENWISARWSLILLALTAFFIGPRKAYLVFDVAKVAVGLIVLTRIGPRYWGATSWCLSAKKVS